MAKGHLVRVRGPLIVDQRISATSNRGHEIYMFKVPLEYIIIRKRLGLATEKPLISAGKSVVIPSPYPVLKLVAIGQYCC